MTLTIVKRSFWLCLMPDEVVVLKSTVYNNKLTVPNDD
jgi:hypothetical protein